MDNVGSGQLGDGQQFPNHISLPEISSVLGEWGKQAVCVNLRTHTIRFVNLGAQVECVCVCVCVCAILTEESSVIHFVIFKRPQLVDAGD